MAVTANDMAYSAMVAGIRTGLVTGTLPVGARLPSEPELARTYGISITSVRAGVGLLVREGLLVRRHGSGTYVAAVPPEVTVRIPRADTVALVSTIVIPHYHPYFSELHAALRRRLTELGWQVWDCLEHSGERGSHGGPIAYRNLDEGALLASLDARGGMAGAVVATSLAEPLASRFAGRFPVVAFGECPGCCYADYDWVYETERALRLAVREGARRICCFSGLAEDTAAAVTRRACLLARDAGIRGVAVQWRPLTGQPVISEMIHGAYEAAQRLLTAEPRVDGVVVMDDFALQGVLDALVRLGKRAPAGLRLVAQVSAMSRIRTAHRFTALVADGALAGRETADLLDAHIRDPHGAPARVQLACSVREAGGADPRAASL